MRKKTSWWLAIGVLLLGCRIHAATTADGFRLVWAGGINLNLDQTMERIRGSGFNAVAVSGANINTLIPYGQKHQVEVYYWLHLVASEETKAFAQRLTPAEDEFLKKLAADNAADKHGYQFGSEPLPGRVEALDTPLLCFHQPEVVERCKKHLAAALEMFPELTGIALSHIGYQNYRNCHCPRSNAMFEEYYRPLQGGIARAAAMERFSRETLTQFINDLAAHVRRLRPAAKIAVHVFPAFLPEPLYGNRLNADYCCQTVAWFAQSGWPPEKTSRYAAAIVERERQYFSAARGVPLLGLRLNQHGGFIANNDFFQSLAIVKKTVPGRRDLSVFSLAPFAADPALGQKLAGEIAR